jgi:hypothetical protein
MRTDVKRREFWEWRDHTRCLVAGHQANASIRGHADTMKVMIAEVLKMRLPGGRTAV